MVSALFRRWSAANGWRRWRWRRLTVSGSGASASDDLKCTGNPDIPWAEQIGGCTAAIGSGRYTGADLAQAFDNRGNAYIGTGDLTGRSPTSIRRSRVDSK